MSLKVFSCLLVHLTVHGLIPSLGVKEIDIAATLEHVRDQRPGMVRTKVSGWLNKQPVPQQKFPQVFSSFVNKRLFVFFSLGYNPLVSLPLGARGEQPHPP